MSLKPHNSLEHVGIIPDGNRRWAKLHPIVNQSVYRLTAQKVADLINIVPSKGIPTISIYMLSKDNMNRSEVELNAILEQIPYFILMLCPKLLIIGKQLFFRLEIWN